MPFNRLFNSLESDCDVFDKAIELSLDVYVVRGDTRSRFAKFRAIYKGESYDALTLRDRAKQDSSQTTYPYYE